MDSTTSQINSNLIHNKTMPKLTHKSQESINPFQKSNFIYHNNYMAKSIKFIFNTKPNNSTLKKEHKRSTTLSQIKNKKSNFYLNTLTNIFSNTTVLLNNTKHSTFYQKRSISTVTHQELVKDIAYKNMNQSTNQKGNELRAKIPLDKDQINELISLRKQILLKKTPARHATSNSINLKTVEKYKKIFDQKGFEIERKLENNEETAPQYEKNQGIDRIFTLTHNHIEKNWFDSDLLPPISLKIPKENQEKRLINRKMKILPEVLNKEKNVITSERTPPFFKDLLMNVNEEDFPNYNKDFGPANKFLLLENLNKPKKQKDQVYEVIKRNSIVGDREKGKNFQLSEKMSALLKKSYENNTKNDEKSSVDSDDSELENMGRTKYLQKESKIKTKIGQGIRKALSEALKYIGALKLDLRELQTNKIFSNKPYEKVGSYELISACKHSNKLRVQELLQVNKYLVYDFDYVYLTALHWAAKRGELEIAKVLIKFGSDLNSKDLIGRTPLYLAIKHKKLEVMQLLLFHQADPWSTKLMDYKALVVNHPLASKILTRARQLNILLKMTPPRFRKAIWMKDSWTLLMNSNGKDENLLRKILA